ncbi:MAG: hypothetical protein HZC51_12090 [Nitrospirae bacterium]|nr:hypothetical protein [Nitrospirota bacterium]
MKRVMLALSIISCFLTSPSISNAKSWLLVGGNYYQMADIGSEKELTSKVYDYMMSDNFTEIENLAKDIRDNDGRFPEGVHKQMYLTEVAKRYGKNEEGFVAYFDKLHKWSEQFPGSSTERLFEAKAWNDYAWFARGDGFADIVTEKGWKLFDERIKKAYEIASIEPESKTDDYQERYILLQTIARAQSWDRERYDRLFQEAIALDPHYYRFYCERAFYLLPRWYGSPEEWKEFAINALVNVPEKDRPELYTRIVWSIFNAREFQDMGEISWPLMRQGVQDIMARYPGSRWNLNNFAAFALRAQDWGTAFELIALIGDDPYIEVWGSRKSYNEFRYVATQAQDRKKSKPE